MFQELGSLLRSFTRWCHGDVGERSTQLFLEPLEDRCVPAITPWVGEGLGATGDWHTALRWETEAVPGVNDTAKFTRGTSAPRLTDLAVVQKLEVWARQGGAQSTTTIDLNGKNLTVSDLTNVYSAAMALNAPVGGVSADAVLELQTNQAATYQTRTLDVGVFGFTNAANANQNKAFVKVNGGVTLKATDTATVGGAETGQVSVLGGGKFESKFLNIGGVSSTVNGQASLTGFTVGGMNSLATVTGAANTPALTLGQSNGTNAGFDFQGQPRYSYLTINDGGKLLVSAGSILVGAFYRGELKVESGGELETINGRLDIGSSRASLLTVNGGILKIGATLDIGRGTADIGANSSITAKSLLVGGNQTQTVMQVSGLGGATNVQINGITDIKNQGKVVVGVGAKITSTGKLTVNQGGTMNLIGGTFDAQGGGQNNGTINLGGGGQLKGKEVVNKGTLKMTGLDGVGTGTGAGAVRHGPDAGLEPAGHRHQEPAARPVADVGFRAGGAVAVDPAGETADGRRPAGGREHGAIAVCGARRQARRLSHLSNLRNLRNHPTIEEC